MKTDFLILFDLDGTIVDTERIAVATLVSYFLRHGHTLAVSDLTYLVGRPWADAVYFLVERYPIPLPPPEIENQMLVEYRANFTQHLHVIPGSVDAIKNLAKTFPLGLVSGSRRQDIETILAMLKVRDRFQHVLGYENYAEGKPSPVPYLDAIKLFGTTPAKTLVFEDSAAGIRSALDAGTTVVTVGEAITGADTRPPTPWYLPDFLGVTSAWVTERLK